MTILKKEILELLKNKQFEEVENIINSGNYDKYTFKNFFNELFDLNEIEKIEYFYDNYSNKIKDIYFYLAIYNMCNDEKYLPLIEKLSKDKTFIEEEKADHYVLRALQEEQFKIMDYFLNNFELEDEQQCNRILHGVVSSAKKEYFDILYEKYFYQKEPEDFSFLFESKYSNSAFEQLIDSDLKAGFMFVEIFKLNDYLNKNLQNFKFSEDLKNKIIKNINIIRATKNF